MSGVNELITFRVERAEEALALARIALKEKYFNSAASRLYYTCFYLILALFAKYEIKASTHSGVKTIFGLRFIKEGKIEARWGNLINTLLDKRQQGDYGDFMIFYVRRNFTACSGS